MDRRWWTRERTLDRVLGLVATTGGMGVVARRVGGGGDRAARAGVDALRADRGRRYEGSGVPWHEHGGAAESVGDIGEEG